MNSHNKMIFLVDDEELLLKSLERELEPWAIKNKIEIKKFTSGINALTDLECNSESVFLIISDLRMPEINGGDFLLKVSELYPEIKLFLLTAYSEIPGIQKAIKASINRLILKPWDSIALLTDVNDNYQNYKVELENRSLREEIALNINFAGEFQKKLLPKIESINSLLDMDIIYEPVKKLQCGGDYYDYCNIEDDRQIILLGDVTGHGIRPAFVTSMLKVLCALYRPMLNKKEISPSEIISYLNQGLFKSLGVINDILVSLSITLIDHRNKRITYSGAGQMPIYILRNDKLLLLNSDFPAMGFIHDIEYKDNSFGLEKNDLIIMFTDGLVESEKTRVILEKEKIQSLLITMDLTKNPAQKIFNAFKILLDLDDFSDDVTVITARIL